MRHVPSLVTLVARILSKLFSDGFGSFPAVDVQNSNVVATHYSLLTNWYVSPLNNPQSHTTHDTCRKEVCRPSKLSQISCHMVCVTRTTFRCSNTPHCGGGGGGGILFYNILLLQWCILLDDGLPAPFPPCQLYRALPHIKQKIRCVASEERQVHCLLQSPYTDPYKLSASC